MYRYLLYGDIVEADLEIPQLLDVPSDVNYSKADITICKGNISKDIICESEKKFLGEADDRIWFCNSTGVFCVASGRRINYLPKEGCNGKYLRSYLLGFCLALIYYQRKEIAVHCGAVGNDKGAILLAGESGSGKSTLTTRFLTNGYSLVADDIAVIKKVQDGVKVYPAFPMQKLCRDAALAQGFDLEELEYINEDKDKFAVPRREGFSPEPRGIRALICIAPGKVGNVRLTEIMGSDKLRMLLGNLFLKSFFPYMKAAADMMPEYINAASKIPMYVLVRPMSGDSTLEQMELIEKELISKNN